MGESAKGAELRAGSRRDFCPGFTGTKCVNFPRDIGGAPIVGRGWGHPQGNPTERPFGEPWRQKISGHPWDVSFYKQGEYTSMLRSGH